MKVTEQSKLDIALGQYSLTGHRKENEDFYGCITPEGETLRTKGISVVLADGVGGERGGREAGEYAVKSFLFDYYSTPDTWSVQRSVDQVLTSVNRWIYHEGRRFQEVRHMATTFSALVLKGTRYHIAHVGDSRIYLLRDGVLQQMTQDHRWEGLDFSHALTRGIGLDLHLHMDYDTGPLQMGDLFFFCSDGVTDSVADDRIRDLLASEEDPQGASEALCRLALAQGSPDNITAQVVRITGLPHEDEDGIGGEERSLPLIRGIKPGMTLDGYEVLEEVHKGRMAHLYKARDRDSGRIVALKFPSPGLRDDSQAVDRFLREEWAARRLQSPWWVQVIPQPRERRSCLYYVMEYHEGETLREMLDRRGPLPVTEAVDITVQLCKGLSVLHRMEIVHRDIKPENILITPDHRVKILDLGVIRMEGQTEKSTREAEVTEIPGTPNYMAPELFHGCRGDVRSDLFAAGVTLYEMLTGRLPYGEIPPFTIPVYREWTPPTRFHPEIPIWLEVILKKALEKDPQKRYGVMTALLYDLENPDRVMTFGRREPLLDRDPALVWKIGFFAMTCVAIGLAFWSM